MYNTNTNSYEVRKAIFRYSLTDICSITGYGIEAIRKKFAALKQSSLKRDIHYIEGYSNGVGRPGYMFSEEAVLKFPHKHTVDVDEIGSPNPNSLSKSSEYCKTIALQFLESYAGFSFRRMRNFMAYLRSKYGLIKITADLKDQQEEIFTLLYPTMYPGEYKSFRKFMGHLERSSSSGGFNLFHPLPPKSQVHILEAWRKSEGVHRAKKLKFDFLALNSPFWVNLIVGNFALSAGYDPRNLGARADLTSRLYELSSLHPNPKTDPEFKNFTLESNMLTPEGLDKRRQFSIRSCTPLIDVDPAFRILSEGIKVWDILAER